MDTPTRAPEQAIEEAAARLLDAARTGRPCAPVRDLIGSDDVATAYAVQQRLTEARMSGGARVIGRKIGLTSPAVQAQLGVDQPDFGVLFDDMLHVGGDLLPADAVLQARAEAEIAFVLEDDLVDGPLDAAQVRAATAYVVAAIEVCGSRIEGWDITFADTVADNASAGAFVLGPQRVPLGDLDLREVAMRMSVDGVEVSTGRGDACLGDPVAAVVWLARTAREYGAPLRSGQVILSGALGPMRPVAPGSTVRADLTELGSVSFQLSGMGASA